MRLRVLISVALLSLLIVIQQWPHAAVRPALAYEEPAVPLADLLAANQHSSQTATLDVTTWAVDQPAGFGLSLQHPAGWTASAAAALVASEQAGQVMLRGPDGFVQLAVLTGAGATAEAACRRALSADRSTGARFGRRPALEKLVVDGEPACLIWPAADRVQGGAPAMLVAQYPEGLRPAPDDQLQLWADPGHMRALAALLRFDAARASSSATAQVSQ
jgi:hypothetical protein